MVRVPFRPRCPKGSRYSVTHSQCLFRRGNRPKSMCPEGQVKVRNEIRCRQATQREKNAWRAGGQRLRRMRRQGQAAARVATVRQQPARAARRPPAAPRAPRPFVVGTVVRSARNQCEDNVTAINYEDISRDFPAVHLGSGRCYNRAELLGILDAGFINGQNFHLDPYTRQPWNATQLAAIDRLLGNNQFSEAVATRAMPGTRGNPLMV